MAPRAGDIARPLKTSVALVVTNAPLFRRRPFSSKRQANNHHRRERASQNSPECIEYSQNHLVDDDGGFFDGGLAQALQVRHGD